MKVAATAQQPDFSALIPAHYAGSPYLLIIEVDEEKAADQLLKIYEGGPGQELALAQAVLDWDCEVILCGPLEQEPFTLLAEVGYVTRFLAAGLTVQEALNAMRANRLENIRDYIGGTGCGNHH